MDWSVWILKTVRRLPVVGRILCSSLLSRLIHTCCQYSVFWSLGISQTK